MLLFTAPNNKAFDNLAEGTVESLLLPENKDQLANILLYHVALGAAIQSTELSDGQEIKMANEDSVHVSISRAIMKQRKKMKRGIVPYLTDTTGIKINTANVITPDIRALNGIIHVIDEVLLPGEYKKSSGGGSMHGGHSKSSKRGKTSKSAKVSKSAKIGMCSNIYDMCACCISLTYCSHLLPLYSVVYHSKSAKKKKAIRLLKAKDQRASGQRNRLFGYNLSTVDTDFTLESSS